MRRQHHGLRRLGDGARVHVPAIDAELEVQVRASGPTRHADLADQLALLNTLALLDVDLGEVGVDRAAATGVADLDDIAEAGVPAGLLRPRRRPRCARQCRGAP